jgi:hypothetical protein
MNRKQAVDDLLNATPSLWRGRQASRKQNTLPSGLPRLDARLPGKGWPLGAVSELIPGKPGLGELSLLLPALSHIGEQGQWVVLVDPPWVPCPAFLCGHGVKLERLLLVRTQCEKESLWACEQALRSGRGGALLAWPERIAFTRLRRLQLAAEAHAKLAFLFRPPQALSESSPAALRLRLDPGDRHGTRVRVVKCRGNRPPEPVWIPQPYSARRAGLQWQPRETAIHPRLSEDSIQAPATTAVN